MRGKLPDGSVYLPPCGCQPALLSLSEQVHANFPLAFPFPSGPFSFLIVPAFLQLLAPEIEETQGSEHDRFSVNHHSVLLKQQTTA